MTDRRAREVILIVDDLFDMVEVKKRPELIVREQSEFYYGKKWLFFMLSLAFLSDNSGQKFTLSSAEKQNLSLA